MPVQVIELTDDAVVAEIIKPWRTRLPNAGHVFEFALNATSEDAASRLRGTWSHTIAHEGFFAVPVHANFPRLLSFAIRFREATTKNEVDELEGILRDAWKTAITIDSRADVAAQYFCAYGGPHLQPSGQYLKGLSEVLDYFRGLTPVGNLSFPFRDEADQRLEFFDPKTGEKAGAAATVWRSDLSEHKLTLLFAVDDDFDHSLEVAEVSRLLGVPTDGQFTWIRDVEIAGVKVGTVSLAIPPASDNIKRCGVSVDASEYFELQPHGLAIQVYVSSKDVSVLPHVLFDPIEQVAPEVTQFSWLIPNRACYQRLAAVGLDVSWK